MKKTVEWVTITPEVAEKFINSMDGNRWVRQRHVDFLASQMKAGLWKDESGQPMHFDGDGHLVNGQHRCWAVIESKSTIRNLVVRGLNAAEVQALDMAMPRDYSDVAHYQGWNTDSVAGSVTKLFVLGPSVKLKIPPKVQHDWYEHYKEGIDFAIKLRLESRPAPGKSITGAMAAAIARAYYTANTDLLVRFGAILKSGQIEHDTDRAALALRDAWLMGRLGVSPAEQYYKTEGALRAFIERKPNKTVQRPEDEVFKVPALPVAIRYTPIRSNAVKVLRDKLKKAA